MSFDLKQLYQLLPAIHRIRDSEQGKPLEALLAIIAEQIAVLEENLEQLHDDLFIETCAEWVVPYIGELVKARHLYAFPDAPFSARSQVANTIAYRRRKGTAAVLEQLARDVAGWDASVQEYFQILATTQYMQHLRPQNPAMPDLRDTAALAELNTPFDALPHRVDVRNIETRGGRHNIPNVGLFLWRVGSLAITRAPAYQAGARRYCFNPLGLDAPLYNKPEGEEKITHLAGPLNVPMPLSRWRLKQALNTHFGLDDRQGIKSILIHMDGVPLLPGAGSSPPGGTAQPIDICDLGDELDISGHVIGWRNMPVDTIAIDPVLGRLAFPQNASPPSQVQVSYHYGFCARLGGGSYGRLKTFEGALQPVVKVPGDAPSLQAALDRVSASGGVVEIETNQTFVETPVLSAGSGARIELRAADERRPVLRLNGDMVLTGGRSAQVTINGLLISGGRLHLPALDGHGNINQLQQLTLRHCTLVPGSVPTPAHAASRPMQAGVIAAAADTVVNLAFCISGPLLTAETASVNLNDSILDAGHPTAVAYAGPDGQSPGAPLNISNATVAGKVHTRILQLAQNTIFMSARAPADSWPAPVQAQRLQQGCVRYSYLPPGASVPRPYQCHPNPPAEAARLRPVFTSLRYGDAGYGQLSRHCAPEILHGADDQAEMGAFHHLHQPQRVANLRAALDEYLRFGLQAGIFFAS